MHKVFKVLLITMVCLLSFSSVVSAETNSDTDESAYFGIIVENFKFGKDFDGNGAVTTVDNTDLGVIFPKFDSATGIGLAVGGRKGKIGGDLIFLYAEPDAYYAGVKIDSKVQLIDLNFKYFFNDIDNNFQPYLMSGFFIPKFKINKGATDAGTNTLSPAKYTGLGLDFGAGMELKISEKFSVDASALYRYAKISRIKAHNETWRFVDGEFCSDSFSCNVKAKYQF